MASEDPAHSLLDGDTDAFNGITVKPKHYGDITPSNFHHRLSVSLEAWKADGKRGIWIKIPLSQAELVPVATKLGFEFHHARPDYVMMVTWLASDPSTLPAYATNYVGVAGFVVNEKSEVLLVQEKWVQRLKMVHWKLPGGHADQGEDLSETAIRETFEETGIRTEFVSVLCFRHMHSYRWGLDDLYFICLLRPLNTDITISPAEIAAAKWMPVDDYIADPATAQTNRMIAEAYTDGLKRGLFIQPTKYPHFFKNKPDQVMYAPQPFTQSGDQSCDQSCDDESTNCSATTQQKSNM